MINADFVQVHVGPDKHENRVITSVVVQARRPTHRADNSHNLKMPISVMRSTMPA